MGDQQGRGRQSQPVHFRLAAIHRLGVRRGLCAALRNRDARGVGLDADRAPGQVSADGPRHHDAAAVRDAAARGVLDGGEDAGGVTREGAGSAAHDFRSSRSRLEFLPTGSPPNHSEAQDVIDDLPLFCFGVLLDPHETGRHRYHPIRRRAANSARSATLTESVQHRPFAFPGDHVWAALMLTSSTWLSRRGAQDRVLLSYQVGVWRGLRAAVRHCVGARTLPLLPLSAMGQSSLLQLHEFIKISNMSIALSHQLLSIQAPEFRIFHLIPWV